MKRYKVRDDIKEKLKNMVKVAELADGTRSVTEIAKEVNMYPSVVCNYLKDMGLGNILQIHPISKG